MEKCLEDLEQSVRDFSIPELEIWGIRANGKPFQQNGEADFTTRLIEKFNAKMNHDYYLRDSLKVNYDLPKPRWGNRRPDFVLHHNSLDRKKQKMYVEIKTDSRVDEAEITDDLKKIYEAVHPYHQKNKSQYLGFDSGVFLVGKRDRNFVLKVCGSFCDGKNEELLNKMYLLHWKVIAQKLEVEPIHKIVDHK